MTEMGEQNPYREDLDEIQRVKESDPDAAVRLVVTLRAKIESDIEEERRGFHATFADRLVGATPSRISKLVKEFVRQWIDIPARRYLYLSEDSTDTTHYFGILEYLDNREGPIWDEFAKMLGGEDIVQVIVDGRKSHWRGKAIRQASRAAARKPTSHEQSDSEGSQRQSTIQPTQTEPAPATFQAQDKGNLALLYSEGRLKTTVTVATACRFGDVGPRAIQKAIRKGSLQATGSGQNRRIAVDSLLKYFPPENNAN